MIKNTTFLYYLCSVKNNCLYEEFDDYCMQKED